MRTTLSLLFALFALVTLSSSAEAQVIIQGEVTVTDGTNQSYSQQPQGNYVQQGGYVDPNAAYPDSQYVQPVVTAQGPQPVRYIRRSSIIPGILVPGIILLAGGFLAEVIGGPALADSWENSDQLGYSFIPILGPWLQLGEFSDLEFAFEDGIGYFPIIAGLAQGLGLVMTIIGLTVREEWDEPVYALTDDPMGPTLAFDGSRATLSF